MSGLLQYRPRLSPMTRPAASTDLPQLAQEQKAIMLGNAKGIADPMPHNNANLPIDRPEVLTRPKLEGGRRFVMKTDYTAAGDQPTAIDELVAGLAPGEQRPGAARRHRHRQDLHHGERHRGDPAPDADPRPQQDAGRPALRRVQGLLPRQRGRVLRQLLRLLPARGLRPAHGHLHREGRHDQRGDRPDAPLRRPARCWSATT